MTTPKRNEAVAPVAWLVVSGDAKVLCVAEATANAQAFELRKGGYPVTVFPLYLSDSIDALQGDVSRLREDAMRYRELKRGRRQPFGDDFVVRKFNRTFGEEEPVEWSEVERELDNRINLEPPTDGRS